MIAAPDERLVIPGVPVSERRHSRVLEAPLAAKRYGIMLHYDDSTRDDWALEWFEDKRCTNGYMWLVLRDGRVIELADPAKRTPHAGACLVANANSAFYGLSAAANGLRPATEAQLEQIVACCRAVFAFHGWNVAEADHRIVGHDEHAIWTPANTTNGGLWGQLGRKVDPKGQRHDGRPIVDIAEIRARVAEQ